MATELATQSLHLYKLPHALRVYNTQDLSDFPIDDHCWVCWRDYGIFERGEKPCIALRLQPCGHRVGSECFKALCRNGKEECQLCWRPIDVVRDPVPGFVRWVVTSLWFTKAIDYVVPAIRKDMRQRSRYETLMRDLFRDGLSRKRGYELWNHFVKPIWVKTAWVALPLAGMQIVFSPLAWLVDMRYPELFLFKEIIGFHTLWEHQGLAIIFDFAVGIRWLVCIKLGLNTRSGLWICRLSFLRAFTVLLTWEWCLGLLVTHFLTYSFFVAFLIFCGSWKRKQI